MAGFKQINQSLDEMLTSTKSIARKLETINQMSERFWREYREGIELASSVPVAGSGNWLEQPHKAVPSFNSERHVNSKRRPRHR
jgi:hypothetical protein